MPTGFIHYDNASYMPMGREHFDEGFSHAYGLPFSSDPQTPAVYFQPQTLVLGTLLELTDIAPGELFFGAVSF